MDENELISKKELLKITGISYGQLYRWKRENLIPESWFIKKSSYTGQETFFPKEKILKRTEMILELKDKYSLEELANILTPEATNRTIGKNELYMVEEVKPEITELFVRVLKKDYFNFTEFLFVYIVSKLKDEFELSTEDLDKMAESIVKWLPFIRNMTYRYILCRTDTKIFTLLLQHDAVILLDKNTEELKVFYLDELSKDLNLKFNEVLEGM